MIPFNRVAILGTGLIGSSLGLAIKAARPTTQIAGFDASLEVVRSAQRVKAVDRVERLLDAVTDADLVVVSTPVGAMEQLFQDIAGDLKPGAVVIDTGSTKGRVLQWADQYLPEHVEFVGGHPMAGKTVTGPDAADARLFAGAVWCVVPSTRASQEAIDQVLQLLESIHAVAYFVDADEHDGIVASVSHLPYFMSVALISHLGKEASWRETASLAASGFAYATHLSDTDPQMFADVARTNRENIVRRIDLYVNELLSLRDAIAEGDPNLKQRLEEARSIHQDWVSGRAQGVDANTGVPIPTTRSFITTALLGNLARDRGADKDREK